MPDNKVKKSRALYLVVGAVLVSAMVLQWQSLKDKNASQIAATVLHNTSPIASFNLSDHKGNTFNQENLTGQWSLLSFGYTHCPDICPMTLNTLNHVNKILREMKSDVMPQTIFITLDPERDDVTTLADYIPWFNKDFIGVTGSSEQIQTLAKNLGIMSQKTEDKNDEGNYQIDHTITIMMIDNRGQLRALSPAPHNAQTIADDFIKVSTLFN